MDSNIPMTVTGISTAVEAGVGTEHSCARLSDQTVKCWGRNNLYQLGDGTTSQRTTPVFVTGLSGATTLVTAGGTNCIKMTDQTVKCWGSNSYGQLGDGTTTDRSSPATVPSLTSITKLSIGGGGICGILIDLTAKCLGANLYGSLGDGFSSRYRFSPISIPLSGVKSLSIGDYTSCAVTGDNTVKCWGYNSVNQLGVSITTSRYFTPTTISGLDGAIAVNNGGATSCALMSDRTVKCFGANWSGQVGDGTTSLRLSPVTAINLADVASFGKNSSGHYCVVLNDKTAKCWADNNFGQLGDGTTVGKYSATPVSGLSGIKSIANGASHTCALLDPRRKGFSVESAVISAK